MKGDLGVRRFAGWGGAAMAYREVGDGRPVVLLHGFTADGTQWLHPGPATDIAERGYRVILPDLRGHGASARPHDPTAYPRDVLADDGLAMIDALGLTDYDLGGYSLGGCTALRMLARGARPSRAIIAGQGLASVTRTSGDDRYRRVLTALIHGDPPAPGSADAEQAYWITHLGGDPQALLHVHNSHVPTPEAALAQIPTRTLVTTGEADPANATADPLAQALPSGTYAPIRGDHFTALTTPEFTTTVLTFLNTST